jgi:N-acetylglutamate synthase-like GNAT family acetyltransferase
MTGLRSARGLASGDASHQVPAVESTALNARRANIEDLPGLQALWQTAGLPWEELEKFLTEFQVVTGDNGSIVGAIGLLLDGSEGLLHTEAVGAGDLSDEHRAALWRRVQIVARNQGAHRVWTQEDAPYWSASGFSPATPASKGAQASFLDDSSGWSCFQLVDPTRAQAVVQEQMAVWETARQLEADEFQQRMKMFRAVAYSLAGLAIILLVALLLFVLKTRPDIVRRLGH